MINYNRSPKHEEFLRKKRKKRILKYWITLFFILLILSGIIYLLHRQEIRVNGIFVEGTEAVSTNDVRLSSLEYMQGSFFWLFPKNSIFWYPRKSLEEHLLKLYPRIETVDVGFKNLHAIKIDIKERETKALWCYLEESLESCYLLDKDGFIFARTLFHGDYIKMYGLISKEDPIGKYYLSSTFDFSEINSFIEKLEELSLVPVDLIGKSETEFSVVLGNNSQIHFDLLTPLPEVFANLKALLTSAELANSDRSDLPVEYVDLRFGNKLFYKLRSTNNSN